MHPRASLLVAAALSVVVAGCGPKAPAPKGATGPSARGASSATPASGKATDAPAPLAAHLVLTAPEATFGPYVARRGESSMAVWAAGGDGPRRWVARPLGADGAAKGPAVDVGPAPSAAPSAIVRGLASGWILLWIEHASGRASLHAALLSDGGEPKGAPFLVAETDGDLPYADALGLAGGPLVLLAIAHGGAAEVQAVALASDGRPRGAPTRVIARALAWQAVATGPSSGAVAAVVLPEGKAQTAGAVELVRVDAAGKPVGKAVTVGTSTRADPDVDMVALGDRVVLAWTERKSGDGAVVVAAVDRAGAVVTKPTPLQPGGDQSLLGLVALPDGTRALAAWDDLAARRGASGSRTVALATLGPDARPLGDRATLVLAGDDANPELAAFDAGFVATTLGAACLPGRCADAAVVPSLVRFGRDLTLVSSAPLLAGALRGDAHAAALAWGLGCGKADCFVLATDATSPAPVLALVSPQAATGWQPLAARTSEAAEAKLGAIETIATTERLADVAVGRFGARTLVAWVTYFVDGSTPPPMPMPGEPGDPKKPRAAIVAVRPLDAHASPSAEPTLVSVRAASVGGVAIAAEPKERGDACLAWVARDDGDLQVFLTRVGPDGKKKAQQMLTRAKGDASDVAIAAAGDGWVVAWVDGRDGNGEVYAARVGRDLKRIGDERRVTSTPGDASAVHVAVRGDEVAIGWTEVGTSGPEARAARLALAGLAPRGDAFALVDAAALGLAGPGPAALAVVDRLGAVHPTGIETAGDLVCFGDDADGGRGRVRCAKLVEP